MRRWWRCLDDHRRTKYIRWFNLTAAAGWAASGIYGAFVGWMESIPYLFCASVWANVVGHLSAQRADVPDPEVLRLLNAILEKLEDEARDRGGG